MTPKVSLIVGILFISFSPIFIKLADEPGVTAAFYRILIAVVALLPYCVAKGQLKISRKGIGITILCGVVFALDVAVWHISILKISATVSTLLANLAPVWVGLFSYLMFKQYAGRLFWAGTALSIVGMVILVGYQNIINLTIDDGVLLAILASFLYGGFIMLSKVALQRVPLITFLFYNMLVSTICLYIVVLVQGANLTNFSASVWWYFIGLGLICQLAGWITINYAIKKLPSTKVSISLLSQTVVTGLLAVWLLNEKLGIIEIIGSITVLAGIAITFFKPDTSNKIVN